MSVVSGSHGQMMNERFSIADDKEMLEPNFLVKILSLQPIQYGGQCSQCFSNGLAAHARKRDSLERSHRQVEIAICQMAVPPLARERTTIGCILDQTYERLEPVLDQR